MEGGGIVIKYMFLIMSYHVLRALIGVQSMLLKLLGSLNVSGRRRKKIFKFRSKVRISQMQVDGDKMHQEKAQVCTKTRGRREKVGC